MNPLPDKIAKFISRHHVLTLATYSKQGIWCSNLFYAFDKYTGCFIFTSSHETRHAQEMIDSPDVAASIVLETRIVGKIQGLQFTGKVSPLGKDAPEGKAYIKRFPYTILADLDLWSLEMNSAKLTDNTLGFGKKLHWTRHG